MKQTKLNPNLPKKKKNYRIAASNPLFLLIFMVMVVG